MFSVDFGVGRVSRVGSPDCGLEKNSNSINPPLGQIIGRLFDCVEEEIFEFILPFFFVFKKELRSNLA